MNTKVFRIVLIGNSHVGKTSIVHRLVNQSFDGSYDMTIGTAFYTHLHTIGNKQASLQIWDTAGEEKYRSIGQIYYRNTSAALVVYDQTDISSFRDLTAWIDSFRSASIPNAIIAVVGNKNDEEDHIEVPQQMGESFSAENGFLFFSVSAKTGQNVERMFQTIGNTLLKGSVPEKEKSKTVLKEKKEREDDGCC